MTLEEVETLLDLVFPLPLMYRLPTLFLPLLTVEDTGGGGVALLWAFPFWRRVLVVRGG